MIDSQEFDRTRSICKTAIENLEVWLRNVIESQLSKKYGNKFWDYKNEDGARIIRNSIIKDAKHRFSEDPNRYPRFVDALLLDDAIKIFCNPNLYDEHFKSFLVTAFSNGTDVARVFLERLVPIRNKLSHAQPISNHEALQVLCYSKDTIESIKKGFKDRNMEKIYNAPTFIGLTDSLGNQFSEAKIIRNNTGRGMCHLTENNILSVGDILVIETAIDPSFDSEQYLIEWVFHGQNSSTYTATGNRIEIQIDKIHIRHDFNVFCKVTSNKDWHRCGDVDDSLHISYIVQPNE
ncbi:MAG: hypothetical protein AAGC64_04625 [Bacteroidota bacterium]